MTAPVGTHTVNVRNGNLSASKTVTIAKDETTSVDFSEVQSDPVKMGAVNFSVTPKGAVLRLIILLQCHFLMELTELSW